MGYIPIIQGNAMQPQGTQTTNTLINIRQKQTKTDNSITQQHQSIKQLTINTIN
jgi:hypothetical protein